MRWREVPATAVLTVVTLAVSLLILLAGWLPEAAVGGGVIPARVSGAVLPDGHFLALPVWLTPLSATLVHGGIAHVALNLVMLAYCGAQAERALGSGGLSVLYVVGAYAAAAGQWALAPASPMPMIGASAAISAVVAGYALLYGERRARRIGPFPGGFLHVLWLAAAWIGIQAMIGVAGIGGGPAIAIGAHVGGFLAGLALTRPLLLWRYRHA
jgi:membrane associated rhomboid family serine protease